MNMQSLESRKLLSAVGGNGWSATLTARQSLYVSTNDQAQSITVERGGVAEIGRHLNAKLVNNRIEFTSLPRDKSGVGTVSRKRDQNIRGAIRSSVGSSRILLVSIAGVANILIPNGDFARVSIDAGGGKDLIQLASDVNLNVTLIGGAGNDTIKGGTRSDDISGGSGNDWIATYATKSRLDGGRGDDILFAGHGADTIIGGSGSDTLFRDGEDSVEGVELTV